MQITRASQAAQNYLLGSADGLYSSALSYTLDLMAKDITSLLQLRGIASN